MLKCKKVAEQANRREKECEEPWASLTVPKTYSYRGEINQNDRIAHRQMLQRGNDQKGSPDGGNRNQITHILVCKQRPFSPSGESQHETAPASAGYS